MNQPFKVLTDVLKATAIALTAVGLIILFFWTLNYATQTDRYDMKPSHNQILYKKDSLEMEYYKQLLDTSYNFDHSKIPDEEPGK